MNFAATRRDILKIEAHLKNLPSGSVHECVFTLASGHLQRLAHYFRARDDSLITAQSENEIRVHCLKAAVSNLLPLSPFQAVESLSIRTPWPCHL